MKDIKFNLLSTLVKEMESTFDELNSELSDIKATMIVNWCKDQDRNPKLLDGSEKTAKEMFLKIMDYYLKNV
jgi:hypothetical protein